MDIRDWVEVNASYMGVLIAAGLATLSEKGIYPTDLWTDVVKHVPREEFEAKVRKYAFMIPDVQSQPQEIRERIWAECHRQVARIYEDNGR